MAYSYQPYPAWRYHKTLPARIVDGPDADQALGDEWADSPDASRPKPHSRTVRPVEAAPAPVARRIEKYPAWRYHPTQPARIVDSASADAALGEDWRDYPYPERPAVALESVPDQAEPVVTLPAPPPVPVLSDAELAARAELAREAAAARDLHETPWNDVVKIIQGVEDLAALHRIRAREAMHPKIEGGRKMVHAAIDTRIEKLRAAEPVMA